MNLSSKQKQKIDIGHKVIYTTHLDLALSISNTNTEMRAETKPCNHAPSDTRKMIHEAMSTPKLHCEL